MSNNNSGGGLGGLILLLLGLAIVGTILGGDKEERDYSEGYERGYESGQTDGKIDGFYDGIQFAKKKKRLQPTRETESIFN